MTIYEYRERLVRLKEAANQKAAEKIIVPAANRLLGTIRNRIQVEGENSNGQQIGQYSQKPMYAGREEFVKKGAFKPVGKSGKKKAPPNKTMYLPGGYKQLRDIQGRPTGKKNYTYTGDLMASYIMQKTAKGVLLGLNSELQAKKRQGLQKQDGKVFYAQKEEIDNYNKEVSEQANLLTKEILSV